MSTLGFPFGLREIDQPIILDLDDLAMGRIGCVNKYLSGLFADDGWFWREKLSTAFDYRFAPQDGPGSPFEIFQFQLVNVVVGSGRELGTTRPIELYWSGAMYSEIYYQRVVIHFP